MSAGEEAGVEGSAPSLISVAELRTYVSCVAALMLEIPKTPLEEFMLKQDVVDRLNKFIGDSAQKSFILQYKQSDGDEDNGTSNAGESSDISLSLDIQFASASCASVVFVKKGTVLEADKTLPHQLHFVKFSEGSPFEVLHSYLHNAISPFFSSYASKSAEVESDAKVGLSGVKKKIAELELCLLHLQQNIDIPEIHLVAHPFVAQTVAKCRANNSKITVEAFGEMANDSNFLNALQGGVNRWIREIQKVTKLERDPSSGAAVQEVSFWLNLERALHRVTEQLKADEIVISLAILKHAKRFHATVSFDSDTGLKQTKDRVMNYNMLMKDFPLNEVLAATELDKINTALVDIFTHMKKIRSTSYPVSRSLHLLGAISRDFSEQLFKILSSRKLMLISFEEFEKLMSGCTDIFNTWDDQLAQFRDLARELSRKRGDEKLPIRVNSEHIALQERLEQIRKFRKQHEQLRFVINRVLSSNATGDDGIAAQYAKNSAIEEIDSAYGDVKVVDVLDLSPEGLGVWDASLKNYDDRVDRVETQITARLRDQLGVAKNANEMFRIFSKYNALFVRPRIRGAIQEYQAQLIQRVKDDINTLHDKFKVQYPRSEASRMSNIRDLPPVSGAIIWARQIERQLAAYMKRVEDVLGKGWEKHIDGQKLKADGESFLRKLNTKQMFDNWAAEVESRQFQVTGRIFDINAFRNVGGDKGQSLRLLVNFDAQIITLFKEVRNLQWLGYRVPFNIQLVATGARQVYPFAVSLMESIRTYTRVSERMKGMDIAFLVASYRNEVHGLISEGVPLHWESHRLDSYVRRIGDSVSVFQDKVDDLMKTNEQMDLLIDSLGTCELSGTAFSSLLEKMQKLLDEMNLRSYSNLSEWVSLLEQKIEERLTNRLCDCLKVWKFYFDRCSGSDNKLSTGESIESVTSPNFRPVKLEVVIRNQQIDISPSLCWMEEKLYFQFHEWVGMISNLSRLVGSRYEMDLADQSVGSLKYANLLAKLPCEGSLLKEAYDSVARRVLEVKQYIRIWFQYQSLWDMDSNTVFNRLGDDLSKWQSLLVDIKRARSTFDTSESEKHFANVIINYKQVQSKVNLKYDTWHKDMLNQFGVNLDRDMKMFYTQITESRVELERQSVEGVSTGNAVEFITYVQDLKRQLEKWTRLVENFRNGQKILERQRYQFPSDWLYCDNIDGEWSAFNDILKRKDNIISSMLPELQTKIAIEEKSIKEKIDVLSEEWENEKPVKGSTVALEALRSLQSFETRLKRLQGEAERIVKANDALELDSVPDNRIPKCLEELVDFKSVWEEISTVWNTVFEFKETSWASVSPRKVRQGIDELLSRMKSMPNFMRQYDAFIFCQSALKKYLKMNILVVEMKSEALKERHWKQISKKLRVSWTLSELTLGNVWDADLIKNESLIKDILTVAQGEMALEAFLSQIRETLQSFELELVNYQNKCRLIRGWEDLFAKLKENLNSLGAMKLSPYFRTFEEEALSWEDKLNKMSNLFDIWIDVQRKWVYLEGIFTSSVDIKHLLPVETSRFQSISSEFLALMKKVNASPLALDVLGIAGVLRALERLSDLLNKIQKALGEYLERERSFFSRFYFVGDEDLLEIIGNSLNVPKLQKHFKKMFAGISSLLLDEGEDGIIVGMCSKEGEEVKFLSPVSLAKAPKVNEWLSAVEEQMRLTLAYLLSQSVKTLKALSHEQSNGKYDSYIQWVDSYPLQIVVLAQQIIWSEQVEVELSTSTLHLEKPTRYCEDILSALAEYVLGDQPSVRRRKLEHSITELVHQRDILRSLVASGVTDSKNFEWTRQMRFYFNPSESVLNQVVIKMANSCFNYGFEYLGITDKLVQTPLTDRCYLTMTQALEWRLGGSPFGPAGTGKTESVKALGHQLGRFVLVFNCDEKFDFQAMGRIFIGLCQVGAWGCFDEFNRLEERILSAVSQQIQSIQMSLRDSITTGSNALRLELLGRSLSVNPNMAIFITMNPGYAGRSNLPDNLKKLFRSLAMTKPDRQLIAQVMLYAQGFKSAEILSNKIVPLFKLCHEQLSSQSHYDFGLRALKSVLLSAGNIKRERIRGNNDDSLRINLESQEQEVLIQSIHETLMPKLVASDIPLLNRLIQDVFPGISHVPGALTELRTAIQAVCKELFLRPEDLWLDKILQLYQIQCLHHGVMMVGPSGSGKSCAWRVLAKALELMDKRESVCYVIDPKAISKDELYGNLDSTTREWNDGLFTRILRRIIDNVRNEASKRHWFIFDGDVDPEWVENLNSVLDDNKILTLPNGERLNIPSNVRIMFEVQNLKYATLATVSRCGMIWFSEDVVPCEFVFYNFFERLRHCTLDSEENNNEGKGDGGVVSPLLSVQRDVADYLIPMFKRNGIVLQALSFSKKLGHVMKFSPLRVLGSLFAMIEKTCTNVHEHNETHSDFPMSAEVCEQYSVKRLVYSLVWCFSGDCKYKDRVRLSKFIEKICTISLPDCSEYALIDYEVTISGEWAPWQSRVPVIEVETHRVGSPDVVVPTIDTVRHEDLLYTWLAGHKPMILCGPPGSGKTMTLFSALRALPEMEVVGLNFSSASTPELLIKTFEHYCEYKRTPKGLTLSPMQIGKWIIIFCDEINLPDVDSYGTQRIISFIRQMVEHGGFWRTSDQTWVHLDRIQFVGACNPPTDPGRKPLSERFLRHVPVVFVDYPAPLSLKQIYGTFNRALMRLFPSMRSYSSPLTDAMVEFYAKSQETFTVDSQPHYIYSPRELTRWVRGIYEAIKPLEVVDIETLARVWAHEGLRLFQDRLVHDDERQWTEELIDEVAIKHFTNMDADKALKRPILFSNWLSKDYLAVDREELREYTTARLKVFYEEELDVPLVLFNEVLDHVLRIDRVFRQVQGHLLLIGVSGSGKTTLSRFVAWMNGLSVFQIKVHHKYSAEDFEEDLRSVLKRSGCKGEKICFIMDESNILEASFLERMNTLLANGEVPGLFEGDEFTALMTSCKEGSQKEGLMLDSNEELYQWFCGQIMKNLHIVFTMNPSVDGLKDRAATSPALFNRCVLDWFGDWSDQALYQVGSEFTTRLDLDKVDFIPSVPFPSASMEVSAEPSHREAIIDSFVYIHKSVQEVNENLRNKVGLFTHVTPRHYLDFIKHYVSLFGEKRNELEDQQLHIQVGLSKITETVEQVEELQKSLSHKNVELEQKNEEANVKLKQMVEDQQDAEKKKAASLEIQEALIKQNKEIEERRVAVVSDLADVEPAVQEAAKSVKSIKKQQLVEVRGMGNPPQLVKLTMEAICILLGESNVEWKSIRTVLVRDDFISNIVNFDTDNLSESLRLRVKKEYISKPDFNYESINRASKACGPLAQWVIAQVMYSEALNKVEPLRNELRKLEEAAEETKIQDAEMRTMISELELSIAKYKEEYASLISSAESIKSEMSNVKSKVDRSIALIGSLASENERWKKESEQFKFQMETLPGDILLSAAFMTYSGYFDQRVRNMLLKRWMQRLHNCSIICKKDLSLVHFLSSPDERLNWQSNTLPDDNICNENAIVLNRFNRYPLVIDPSGQASQFILNQYKDKKIIKTSFLDDSFRKNLESALRFGNPVLVQDAENYDPILNPVLNRELRKAGGRVLIRVGDQDIDFSPSFVIFLSTRDPTHIFPPDVCSRVTLVNFTVTMSSLQSQCLNKVLKKERPDVDQKYTDILKLQGEFKLRLRQLEKSLLDALNGSEGKLLDNDNVITTLEVLKKEAAEVEKKVEETDAVMQDIENVSNSYLPIAISCSSLYFTLEQLNQIKHLYQFSLNFFLDVFEKVLKNSEQLTTKDSSTRVKELQSDLFRETFQRASNTLLHDDRMMFLFMLCRIFSFDTDDEIDDIEYEHFLRHDIVSLSNEEIPLDLQEKLSSATYGNIIQLFKLESFEPLKHSLMPKVSALLDDPTPEQSVLKFEEFSGRTQVINVFRCMLFIQAVRPDRLLAMGHLFVESCFRNGEMRSKDIDLDVISREGNSKTPIILCCAPGYDASGRVDELSDRLNITLFPVAIGSSEGFTLAEKAITQASKTGAWVLLKNVHLTPQWLVHLEKKLHMLSPHEDFRIFMSADIQAHIPVNLLRMSRICVFEAPPGVKASLHGILSSISLERSEKKPNERSRVHFLVAWLHAVIQERLRYAPIGWSKKYEFSESDLKCTFDLVDHWIDSVGEGRANISPDKIPWNAISNIISSCIYGARLDNDFDQKYLNTLVQGLFNPQSFNVDFVLAEDANADVRMIMPDSSSRDGFLKWVEELPNNHRPAWLGLPDDAEKMLLIDRSERFVSKLLKMKTLVSDTAESESGTRKTRRSSSVADGKPSWMATVATLCHRWLEMLTVEVVELERNENNIQDPLFRYFEREVFACNSLLKTVREDLIGLLAICEESAKQTNDSRSLITDILKGELPKSWIKYSVPSEITVNKWMVDFAARCTQMESICEAKAFNKMAVWIGGLFIPEAYITATRQFVAQSLKISLEELELCAQLSGNCEPSGVAFKISGLKLYGGNWVENRIDIGKGAFLDVGEVCLSWLPISDKTIVDNKKNGVLMPIYLNTQRNNHLFSICIIPKNERLRNAFYERGCAFIASDL